MAYVQHMYDNFTGSINIIQFKLPQRIFMRNDAVAPINC